jgi:hypothetical protein
MRALRDGLIFFMVIAGLLVGSVFACDAWDASFHTEVKARLSSATPVCRLRRSYGGRAVDGGGKTEESGDLSCEEARRRAPAERAAVLQYWDVAYDYVSPVDQARHNGAFRTPDPLYGTLRPGAEINILAHKSEAGTSRERALLH